MTRAERDEAAESGKAFDMTIHDDPAIPDPSQDIGRFIDRLVDGTLRVDERRALLLRLEAEPEGWRLCALAFLEAQAWREALSMPSGGSELARRARPSHAVIRLERGRAASPGWGQSIGALSALAAGFILAFFTGWLAGGATHRAVS